MLGKTNPSSGDERLTVDNLWKILSDKDAAPRELVASPAGHHSGSNDGSRNRQQQGSSVERQQRL